MKTIDELYKEVVESEELKKEFLSLKADKVEEFAKTNGCDATFDEIKAFFENRKKDGELSDAELGQIAGGKGANVWEALTSVFTVGLGCAVMAYDSWMDDACGTAIEGDGMLCKPN